MMTGTQLTSQHLEVGLRLEIQMRSPHQLRSSSKETCRKANTDNHFCKVNQERTMVDYMAKEKEEGYQHHKSFICFFTLLITWI